MDTQRNEKESKAVNIADPWTRKMFNVREKNRGQIPELNTVPLWNAHPRFRPKAPNEE